MLNTNLIPLRMKQMHEGFKVFASKIYMTKLPQNWYIVSKYVHSHMSPYIHDEQDVFECWPVPTPGRITVQTLGKVFRGIILKPALVSRCKDIKPALILKYCKPSYKPICLVSSSIPSLGLAVLSVQVYMQKLRTPIKTTRIKAVHAKSLCTMIIPCEVREGPHKMGPPDTRAPKALSESSCTFFSPRVPPSANRRCREGLSRKRSAVTRTPPHAL